MLVRRDSPLTRREVIECSASALPFSSPEDSIIPFDPDLSHAKVLLSARPLSVRCCPQARADAVRLHCVRDNTHVNHWDMLWHACCYYFMDRVAVGD